MKMDDIILKFQPRERPGAKAKKCLLNLGSSILAG